MDLSEAARRLGVAAHEIVDIRDHAGWWEVRHHDMASHEETWRPVPGAPEAVPDDVPVETEEPEPAAPTPRRKGSR